MDDLLKEAILNLAFQLERAHSVSATWVAKDVARKLKKLTQPSPSHFIFTARENEILQHVANGFTNLEIALL